MEAHDKVLKKLEGLEKRIVHLESLILDRRPHVVTSKRKTLRDHILSLRDEGFFSEPRTAQETHQEVQKSYPCELNRVEVVLYKLAQKRQLRKANKTINGKEYNAYAW